MVSRGRPALRMDFVTLKTLLSEGYGSKAIARILTEQGKPVSAMTIYRLLQKQREASNCFSCGIRIGPEFMEKHGFELRNERDAVIVCGDCYGTLKKRGYLLPSNFEAYLLLDGKLKNVVIKGGLRVLAELDNGERLKFLRELAREKETINLNKRGVTCLQKQKRNLKRPNRR